MTASTGLLAIKSKVGDQLGQVVRNATCLQFAHWSCLCSKGFCMSYKTGRGGVQVSGGLEERKYACNVSDALAERIARNVKVNLKDYVFYV